MTPVALKITLLPLAIKSIVAVTNEESSSLSVKGVATIEAVTPSVFALPKRVYPNPSLVAVSIPVILNSKR